MTIKLYTKTGDKGETSLVSGTRVSKTHERIEAYGTVDELNSFIGLALSLTPKSANEIGQHLLQIQNALFNLGSQLACDKPEIAKKLPSITQSDIKFLEQCIDNYYDELPQLREFILPGGHAAASALHCARSICRRAERATLKLENGFGDEAIVYLNRLSDYLFAASRYLNLKTETAEITWKK